MMEFGGGIDFCPNCRRLLDYALSTNHKDNLYIQINKEVDSPENRVIIPLCDVCQRTCQEYLPGVDGFLVSHTKPNK